MCCFGKRVRWPLFLISKVFAAIFFFTRAEGREEEAEGLDFVNNASAAAASNASNICFLMSFGYGFCFLFCFCQVYRSQPSASLVTVSAALLRLVEVSKIVQARFCLFFFLSFFPLRLFFLSFCLSSSCCGFDPSRLFFTWSKCRKLSRLALAVFISFFSHPSFLSLFVCSFSCCDPVDHFCFPHLVRPYRVSLWVSRVLPRWSTRQRKKCSLTDRS